MKHLNKITQGNCLELIPELPENSIDLMVTDPPYGINFMCSGWDKCVPPVDVWRECLRVLKPGAFAFVMSSPRQDVLSRMIVNLEDAGFNVGFTSLYWTYATGFPKAMNIGKVVDKKMGAEREVVGRRHKRGGGTNNKRYYHLGGLKNQCMQDITLPATPQAKALDGSYGGFQPKPAVEVILVVMKPPSEKTYVEQALNNGKGITWLDDGRIPYKDDGDYNSAKHGLAGVSITGTVNFKLSGSAGGNYQDSRTPDGRFPANLLVSDDVLDDGKVTLSAGGNKRKTSGYGFNPILGTGGYGDIGQFSRYFSLDSWWQHKLKSLPESVRKTFPFLLTPKASKGEKNKGCEGRQDPETAEKKHNNHTTVKPIQLMSYLITIGSRPDDIILDPFCGSGTTCLAAILLYRKYIGFELNQEYADIANKRISNELKQGNFLRL